MIARIRNHDVTRRSERTLDLGCDARVHCAEEQFGRVARLRVFDRQIGHALRHRTREIPIHGIAVLLAGRAVARTDPLQVEPRMTLEKLDEMLAHHSGGAEYAYFDSRLHNSLTMR